MAMAEVSFERGKAVTINLFQGLSIGLFGLSYIKRRRRE